MNYTYEYFWSPRGDVHLEEITADQATLKIVLADYGEGAEIWDIDEFNSLRFFSLQCIVEFWESVKYGSPAAKGFTKQDLRDFASRVSAATTLNQLADLALPFADAQFNLKSDEQVHRDWEAFNTQAEILIFDPVKVVQTFRTRMLSFRVQEAGLLEPFKYVHNASFG